MLIIVIIFCLFFCLPSHAQDHGGRNQEIIVDTVVVKKNSYIVTKDSVYFIDKDTIFYVRDTLQSQFEEVLNEEDYKEEKDFYNNLKKKLSKRKATKELFNLLFDVSEDPKQPKKDSLAHIPERYDGKIAGNIYLKKVDIFGAKVTDTTGQTKSKLAQFINDIHVNTRDQVIINNLLIDKGDFINQYKISDNERILRSLPFIRDARILIQPRSSDSDTVDLLVLTQDVLSISASIEPQGLSAADIHIDDNNILGTGHQLDNAIVVEPREKQYLGYKGTYRLPNIAGSFVQANLNYFNTNFENLYRFQLNREFVVPAIKFAGGMEVSYNQQTALAPWINSYEVIDTIATGTDE